MGGRSADRLLILLLALLIAAAWTGCGKEGDPLPPDLVLPAAVHDLRVERAADGVRVAWTVPERERGPRRFVVQRSEFATVLDRCPDCPRDYRVAADLAPGDPRLLKTGERGTAWLDREVRTGRLYFYRVLLCGSGGVCSDPSLPADIKF